jgi:hypothetical protein
MVPTDVSAVCWEAGKIPELGRDAMGNSSGLHSQADFAGREVGRRAQDCRSGCQVFGSNLVTTLVELCVLRKRAVWILGVLVAFYMAQGWRRVEGVKSVEDLHFDVSFLKIGFGVIPHI